MYFHPLNLLVVLVVVLVVTAWFIVSTRNPELKRNLIAYGALILVTGILLRSFASQWWALIPLAAFAVGVWVWYLRTRVNADTTRAVVVALIGVLGGLFLRDTNIWVALILCAIAVAIAFSGKLTIPVTDGSRS